MTNRPICCGHSMWLDLSWRRVLSRRYVCEYCQDNVVVLDDIRGTMEKHTVSSLTALAKQFGVDVIKVERAVDGHGFVMDGKLPDGMDTEAFLEAMYCAAFPDLVCVTLWPERFEHTITATLTFPSEKPES